jgi:hypothetical protein
VRRWVAALLALLVAAAAVYLLLSSTEPVAERGPDRPDIDSQSRAKLLEVLRKEPGD